MTADKLIFFRPEPGSIPDRAMRFAEGDEAEASSLLRAMLDEAAALGLSGNVWHGCLTRFLLTDENPYTLRRECTPADSGSMLELVRRDLAFWREMFTWDIRVLAPLLGAGAYAVLGGFAEKFESFSGIQVSEMAKKLAEAPDDASFCALLDEHYCCNGAGAFAVDCAFRAEPDGERVRLIPITGTDKVCFADLVGYETQKSALLNNTRAFLSGAKANNVLLYGDSGTGKSTSIKALLNECRGDGLRLIELRKQQFAMLPQLLSQIKRRGCRFIIYIDDLSFEDHEVEYKTLKSVIDGGMETWPDNVLIYATSNRRHLIRESWSDRSDMSHDGDVHRSDTMEEKLSLAGRFGLAINYSAPNPKLYHSIVLALAKREGVEMDEAELLRLSDAWEIRHGGATGRAAKQFINDLTGKC